MLTITQKEFIIGVLERDATANPALRAITKPIIDDIHEDLKRHRTAIQQSKQRNRAKQSRRSQRGPNI